MPALSTRMGVPNGMEAAPKAPVATPQFPPETTQEPTGSGFMRCPMPPIFSSNPDSLRQFYKGGRIPQYRIWSQGLKGNQ